MFLGIPAERDHVLAILPTHRNDVSAMLRSHPPLPLSLSLQSRVGAVGALTRGSSEVAPLLRGTHTGTRGLLATASPLPTAHRRRRRAVRRAVRRVARRRRRIVFLRRPRFGALRAAAPRAWEELGKVADDGVVEVRQRAGRDERAPGRGRMLHGFDAEVDALDGGVRAALRDFGAQLAEARAEPARNGEREPPAGDGGQLRDGRDRAVAIMRRELPLVFGNKRIEANKRIDEQTKRTKQTKK